MKDRIETSREKFHELGRKREAILADLKPHEDELAALVAATHPREKALRDKIRKLREPLFEIDNERAFLARGIGTQTGTPEQYASGKRAEK